MKTEIKLGYIVRDKISGFKGVAVCLAEWLNGCERVTIQPQKLKGDGSLNENYTFDVDQVEILKRNDRNEFRNNTGGPYPEPTR